jgi:hypothetical protein
MLGIYIATGKGVFEMARAVKGFYPHHSDSFGSQIKYFAVPVIAIFTKFDTLMTQIYDINQDDDVNRQNAEEQVEKKRCTSMPFHHAQVQRRRTGILSVFSVFFFFRIKSNKLNA